MEPQLACPMDNISDDDQNFLKDLVKAARQRNTQIRWTDRDGTSKTTVLNKAETERLTLIARQLKLSQAEVLRKASFLPARPAPAPATPPPAAADSH